jgi:hypothetical protein
MIRKIPALALLMVVGCSQHETKILDGWDDVNAFMQQVEGFEICAIHVPKRLLNVASNGSCMCVVIRQGKPPSIGHIYLVPHQEGKVLDILKEETMAVIRLWRDMKAKGTNVSTHGRFIWLYNNDLNAGISIPDADTGILLIVKEALKLKLPPPRELPKHSVKSTTN